MNRRKFISFTGVAGTMCICPEMLFAGNGNEKPSRDYIMTVNGALEIHKMGITA